MGGMTKDLPFRLIGGLHRHVYRLTGGKIGVLSPHREHTAAQADNTHDEYGPVTMRFPHSQRAV
jgi:hypothetical protein